MRRTTSAPMLALAFLVASSVQSMGANYASCSFLAQASTIEISKSRARGDDMKQIEQNVLAAGTNPKLRDYFLATARFAYLHPTMPIAEVHAAALELCRQHPEVARMSP